MLHEDMDEQLRSQLRSGTYLKEGGYGRVVEIIYCKVDLAKKSVRLASFNQQKTQMLKQEGPIGQRLHSHRHFLKHVETFYEGFNRPECQLHHLTFLVANCDLGQFLEDCEELSPPKRTFW